MTPAKLRAIAALIGACGGIPRVSFGECPDAFEAILDAGGRITRMTAPHTSESWDVAHVLIDAVEITACGPEKPVGAE
jgi:hypothetical protein